MRSPLVLLMVASLTAVACKPTPPVPVLKTADGRVVDAPPPADASAEEAAKALASEARSLRANGETALADGKEAELLERFPNTAAAAEIYEQRARSAAEVGATDEAIGYYEKLLFYRPQFVRISTAREAYAKLLLDVGRPKDAA
ncbi:MAG: hypothetical protein AAF658_03445, partial [Myxococcota bacterium]